MFFFWALLLYLRTAEMFMEAVLGFLMLGLTALACLYGYSPHLTGSLTLPVYRPLQSSLLLQSLFKITAFWQSKRKTWF